MSYPVPYSWVVSGTLLKDGELFTQGKVQVFNSLNIEGVKRTLALFAPPIDPALLVKAKANGVSISEVLADASSTLPF